MQRIALPPLDRRLQKRFLNLMDSHMHAATELAAGVASLPSAGTAFAATQAAWRFLNNDRVTCAALAEPLREVGRSRAIATQANFVLLVHDWSKLAYSDAKRDLVQLTHETDVGYELTTALLVSGDDGSPLAPMEMHLRTADGVLSTRKRAPRVVPHLDQLLPTMRASRAWGLTKLILNIVDREADSVGHYREWNDDGHMFLVRADDRRVKWDGESRLLSEIYSTLRRGGKFRDIGPASHRGSAARLFLAETTVVLDRPAKKSRGGRKFQLPGAPLRLRFIIVQLRDEEGQMVLAQWFLLSNMPEELATAEQLAYCYYWRWRIETFFKLLKSHGQHLEQWQQQTGPAIARRLLVAAMACVVVWQLQADKSPEAEELKTVLVRLSGRQMKRTRPHTEPALLAGLWILLSLMALLEHYDLRDLKRLAARIPYRNTG